MPRGAAVGLLMLACAIYGAARLTVFYPHNRLLAAISAAAASAIAAGSMSFGGSADYALGAATALLLVAVTVVPLWPLQCLLMGATVALAGLNGGHLVFFVVLSLAATSIGAAGYAQRRTHYGLYVDALHAAASLSEYQSQAMRAESSATMVRLTAALAHELGSPLGALGSGMDTLIAACARQAQAPPEDQQRLVGLQADLRRSLGDSLARLRKTVNRIQRLTDLDEAATQQANLNELVNEAVGLMKPQSALGTRFDLNLGVMPDVTCRPQRLMAVLCSLLSNSIRAVNGEGRIAISTLHRDSVLEVRIQDNGRGIPAGQLPHIFDPRFEESGGRVATGNWSLFMSKQYIKEHGGDIGIQSLEGEGTTVWLTLPAAS
jgi:signal transduction histidine kinase